MNLFVGDSLRLGSHQSSNMYASISITDSSKSKSYELDQV